jgi:hypothetical protein
MNNTQEKIASDTPEERIRNRENSVLKIVPGWSSSSIIKEALS